MSDLYNSGPSDSDLFMRKWQLTLSGAGGASWTLSDSNAGSAESGGDSTIQDSMRLVFQTRQVSTSRFGALSRSTRRTSTKSAPAQRPRK